MQAVATTPEMRAEPKASPGTLDAVAHRKLASLAVRLCVLWILDITNLGDRDRSSVDHSGHCDEASSQRSVAVTDQLTHFEREWADSRQSSLGHNCVVHEGAVLPRSGLDDTRRKGPRELS
ncbi:MAG: hypothetical protein AAGA81_07535 [Acidobacteriota bacterium]